MNDPRAKPTLFVPLIGIPALSIFFFGGIAFALIQLRAAEDVKPFTTPVAWLDDRARVPNGTFVEIEDTFASGGEEDVHLVGAPDVRVVALQPVVLNRPVRMMGRVCDADRPAMCEAERRESSRASRIFAAGFDPKRVRASATKGWISAAIAVVVYVAMVVFSRRRRKGPPRISDERTWTLPYGAEEIAGRIAKLDGEDRFLVVEEGAGRMVFIQGYSENAARGWGIRKAPVFPRRATLTWTSSPREPTKVVLRTEEDLVWWPAALTPTMDRLAREAIASTSARVEQVLGVR